MIKSDLIKTISKQYNLSTRQATAILQTCLDEIVSGLIKGDTVELRRKASGNRKTDQKTG